MKWYQRSLDHLARVGRQLGLPTILGGHSYRVRGYISNIVSVDGGGEYELLPVIEKLLSRPGVFIDVGANLGQTLGKVLTCDRNRDYLGFEPQITACCFVSRFIIDNRLRNARILPIGLASNNGLQTLYSAGEADTMASLEQSERHRMESVIQIRRGDEVLSELGVRQIAAIKVDVEGAEFEVLSGLRQTLCTHRPPIIFEVLPNFVGPDRVPICRQQAAARRSQAEKLWGFLTELGFVIHQINSQGAEIRIDCFDLDDPSAFIGTNYIAS